MASSIRWRQVLRAGRGDRHAYQGQIHWSWVPTKSQCQRGPFHGFLELYSSGWMLKVTGKLPRPSRPEAPNAPRCSRLRDRKGWPNPPFPHNFQRGVVLDDGELWRAEAGTRFPLFQTPGAQPETTELSIALDGIHWHPSSVELASLIQSDSAGESERAVCAQRSKPCSGAVARA
jgi:hypothetical protein